MSNFSQFFPSSGGTAVSASYSATSSLAENISNGAVSYATLGTEFTNIVTLGAGSTVFDFSAGAIFNKTVSGNETFTFTNVQPGDVKTIKATGGTGITVPASCTTLANQETYDGTKTNVYSIISVSSTEQYNTILQTT